MKKIWLIGLVALFLFIAPVAADIGNPISDTKFCVVDTGTEFVYDEVPFDVTILSNGMVAPRLYATQGRTVTFSMKGYTATRIHFIDHAESVTLYSDGFKAGEIVVYYLDGTSKGIDLIVGKNIADWAYDRPEVQSHLSHSKITPAYSYQSHNTSAYTYNAHLFYSTIETEQKPIDRIELKNAATGSIAKLGIDAITLESDTSTSSGICIPVPNSDFCIVDTTTIDHTYNAIPFKILTPVNGRPGYLLRSKAGGSTSILMNNYTATSVHFLDQAERATGSPNGYNAGKIVVFYQDGTSDSVDLVIGKNIAEWAYDRPEVQSLLTHNKIAPAYSYQSKYDSAYTYSAHLFYSSIDTAPKPIDRIELQTTGNILDLGIQAITLESGSEETITPLCQAGTPFDHTVYPQNTPQSDPMVFQCYWDGTGQVYFSGDQSSLTGIYADDRYTMRVQPSGSLFSSSTDGPSHHPVIELTRGMTPGVNTFTLVVQNSGLSMWYALYPTVSVSQTPYIIQVTTEPLNADFKTVKEMTPGPASSPERTHTFVTRSEPAIVVTHTRTIISTTYPQTAQTIPTTQQPLSAISVILGIAITGIVSVMGKKK